MCIATAVQFHLRSRAKQYHEAGLRTLTTIAETTPPRVGARSTIRGTVSRNAQTTGWGSLGASPALQPQAGLVRRLSWPTRDVWPTAPRRNLALLWAVMVGASSHRSLTV